MRGPMERGNVEKVKRNLFGSPTKADRDAFDRTYQETMAEGRKAMEKKYNFNFQMEMPIMLETDETYEWEELSCQDVPTVFQPQILSDRKNTLPLRTERRRLSKIMPQISRPSLKRQSTDAFGPSELTLRDINQVQARKHRRLTAAVIETNAFRTVAAARKQRRISDVLELTRSRKSPTKKSPMKKMSPRSAAFAKISEMPNLTIMRGGLIGTPERMLTRATIRDTGRGSRRRTMI